MKLPTEVPVMTLPNATLFPQALLPLYIFEPRYRAMLKDALDSTRMFSVAMQKPGRTRETPSVIAGLGLIRVSVGHNDGTSHLILQGLARVELVETVRYKPYRIQRIRPLASQPYNESIVGSLVSRVRTLLRERIALGLPLPFPDTAKAKMKGAEDSGAPATVSPQDVLDYLDKITDPELVADLVSCAVLSGPVERQIILETVNLEDRLRQLIQFVLVEIKNNQKKHHS